jgi:HK97 family phage major capsid protein
MHDRGNPRISSKEIKMKMLEMLQEVKALRDEATAITSRAEAERRECTHAENVAFNAKAGRVMALETTIREAQGSPSNSLVRSLGGDFSKLLVSGGGDPLDVDAPEQRVILSRDYRAAFSEYVSSNGHKVSAALYEGSNPAGGYTVPVVVEGQVVPLAPSDMGVRAIASIIPTSMDIKLPRATAISTAAIKAEGTGSGSNVFTESEPTLDQFTLSAFMAGVLHQISWELAQDVPSFQQFAVGDMLLAQQLFEENLYVNGTGTGQAQGLIGNTGAGVTGVVVGSDAYASELLAATFDVQSTLKTAYHQNAGWLMSRATATVIKKQQSQTNLFTPVWTRENGKDYLHGYPVTFSTAMPAIAASATPVLFGDFKQGYVIGDRGGSGINVKILDQPKAVEGILQLLAYRRTDGRVRRSEAIQAITLHS